MATRADHLRERALRSPVALTRAIDTPPGAGVQPPTSISHLHSGTGSTHTPSAPAVAGDLWGYPTGGCPSAGSDPARTSFVNHARNMLMRRKALGAHARQARAPCTRTLYGVPPERPSN